MKPLGSTLIRLALPVALAVGCSSDEPQQLQTETLRPGSGPAARTGDTVVLHYIGRLDDGRKFADSYQGRKPNAIILGKAEMGPGFDLGMEGMQVGEKRRLTIPPELAYGAGGRGAIDADASLVFEVELLAIDNPPSLAAEDKVVTKLKVVDLVEGTGPGARRGQSLTLHYTGWLTDGTRFDSSRGSDPFPVRLGISRLIQGWHLGLEGMKVGGKRRLIVPPQFGYGPAGSGEEIPPNAVLIFDVDLLTLEGTPLPAPATNTSPG